MEQAIQSAHRVLDPGSMVTSGNTIEGSYQRWPVRLERRRGARGGGRSGTPYLQLEMYGHTHGLVFHSSAVAAFPDAEYQITGDPAFDNVYDVRGAPMGVLRVLFSNAELRRRILYVRELGRSTTYYDLRDDRLQSMLPVELSPEVLGAILEVGVSFFQLVPSAIERSGALAATGGASLANHPEVLALQKKRTTIRMVVFVALGLLIGIPLLFSLVLMALILLAT